MGPVIYNCRCQSGHAGAIRAGDRVECCFAGRNSVTMRMMMIGGKEGEVLHIFVEFKTSWGMSKVVSIDLYGRMADGSIAKETIKP